MHSFIQKVLLPGLTLRRWERKDDSQIGVLWTGLESHETCLHKGGIQAAQGQEADRTEYEGMAKTETDFFLEGWLHLRKGEKVPYPFSPFPTPFCAALNTLQNGYKSFYM